jgi:Glycosyl transferases group 1
MIDEVFVLAPADKRASGGMKVIYRLAEELDRAGIPSAVCHPYRGFRTGWFRHAARRCADGLCGAGTHVVVPEVMAHEYCPRLLAHGIGYSLFVQNAYMVLKSCSPRHFQTLRRCYAGALRVLSISENTSELLCLDFPEIAPRILRIPPYVDTELFNSQGAAKEDLMTYMPRKLPDQADYLSLILSDRLPRGWRLQAITHVSEAQVAALLRRSKVFLSLSHMEGCQLPPLEAALCGNLVVGYDGIGGKEYFHGPIFFPVEATHLAAFVEEALRCAERYDERIDRVRPEHLEGLRARYAAAAFAAGLGPLKALLREWVPTAAGRGPLRLQPGYLRYQIAHMAYKRGLRREVSS